MSVSARPRPPWGWGPGFIGGGLLLAAGAAAIALANTTADHRVFLAVTNSVTVAIFIGVGSYALQRTPGFGKLLLLAGVGWFVVSFGASSSSALYSVGRTVAWAEEALIIYLVLSYPGSRPATTLAKAVAATAVATVALLYIPTAFVVDQFPNPSPYSLCVGGCPANALQLTASEPAFLDVVRPLRELLTTALFLATGVLLTQRLVFATTLMRRNLAPVLVGGMVASLTACTYVAGRLAGLDDDALETLALARAAALPVIGLGFVISLLQWQVYEARALEHMALSSGGEGIAPGRLQGLVREALGDPSAELRFNRDAGWRDVDGDPVDAPSESSGHCVVEADNAAIICDRALTPHRPLVRAAAAWVAIATERENLTDRLERSLQAVQDSRRRLAVAAATERRRIERDLHDGAQQRLVTLRVQLELVDEELQRDPAAGAKRLHELGPSVDAVIDDVRSLARGIYPPLLADAGLAEALRAVGSRQALSVRVEAEDAVRYPLEIESAVYFCCLEALQNAAKHSDAELVTIAIRTDPEQLRFSIEDAGRGFEPEDLNGGAGLTNMRDRIAAVQGRVEIDASPGNGVRVIGTVPARPAG